MMFDVSTLIFEQATSENLSFVISIGVAIFHAVAAIEMLRLSSDTRSGGAFDWVVQSQKYDFGLSNRFLNTIFEPQRYKALMIFRLSAAFMLPISSVNSSGLVVHLVLLGVLLSAQIVQNVRFYYGRDGADQMSLVLLIGLIVHDVGSLIDSSIDYGLLLIAGQATLSYFASGSAKLASKVWRSGEALNLVLNHRSYGSKWLFDRIGNSAKICFVFCWIIIFFQILLPFSVLLPSTLFLVYLLLGIFFHASLTIFMGLGQFFLTFPFSYPAIIYLHTVLTDTFF